MILLIPLTWTTLTSANLNLELHSLRVEMMEEKIIKRLMTSMKCEYCGSNFEMYNVDIIGHREDFWFLKVLCSACHTQCLVAAIVREGRAGEAVTGPSEKRFDESGDDAIEVTDVLGMHDFLRDFDGDFSRLFSQEEP